MLQDLATCICSVFIWLIYIHIVQVIATQNYCNVPLASDGDSVDLVPSFYEEYSGIVNSFICDLDTDDDHDAVPHLHVDPKYIPRNVDRREERKEELEP